MITLNFTKKPSTKAIFTHLKLNCRKVLASNHIYTINLIIFLNKDLVQAIKHMMHKINTVLLCRHLWCHNYVPGNGGLLLKRSTSSYKKQKFYQNLTNVRYSITTNRLLLLVPALEDSQQKRYQGQQVLSSHFLAVARLD